MAATVENENGELDWNVDMEVQFFHAMKGHKPVGVNRYFQMACIHEKFSNSINKEISSKQIWSHLDGMYDMAALHESEIIPFPNNELEFSLPDSDYGSLKSLKFADDTISMKEDKITKSEKSTGKYKEAKNASETLGTKIKDNSGGKTSPASGGTNKSSKTDGFLGSQKSGKETYKSTEKSGKDSKFSKESLKESGASKSIKDYLNKSNKIDGGKELGVVLKNAKDKDFSKFKIDNSTNASKNTKDVIGKAKSLDNLKDMNVKNSKETVNKTNKSDGTKTKGETLNRGKDGISSDDSNSLLGLKPAKLQVLVKDDIVENSPKRKRSGRPLKEDSLKPSSPATPSTKRRRT